jgi:hypothetical protein
MSQRKKERNSKRRFGQIVHSRPPIKMQTDGFVAIGELPNAEHHPCLVCREIPDQVHVDLFTLEPTDIPESIAARVPNTLAVKYRLCSRCYQARPANWKIRLLLLERLKNMAEVR